MESDAASVSTLEDGTTVYRDGSGNITLLQNQAGNPVSLGASSALDQLTNLFTYGVRSAIDSKYRANLTAQQIAAQQAAAGTTTASATSLLLLAGLAFVAFKVIAK